MRPLQKLPFEGSRSNPGKPVKLDWLPLSALRVDDSYQRDTGARGQRLVRDIASHFEWRKFAPVIVAPAGGNTWAIIDGQHRCTAALSLGYDRVPCAIVEAAPHEQAAIFAAVNGDVVRMNILALYKAALAAHVPWAVKIATACRIAGVTPLTKPTPSQLQGPAQTNAIGRMRRIADTWGAAGLEAVLRVVMAHPLAQVPGFINSAQIDAAFQKVAAVPAWKTDPAKAASFVIRAEHRHSPPAAHVPVPSAAPLKIVAVTNEAEARARVQDLKARGFSPSMVAAVTKFRHSVVQRLWGDA